MSRIYIGRNTAVPKPMSIVYSYINRDTVGTHYMAVRDIVTKSGAQTVDELWQWLHNPNTRLTSLRRAAILTAIVYTKRDESVQKLAALLKSIAVVEENINLLINSW